MSHGSTEDVRKKIKMAAMIGTKTKMADHIIQTQRTQDKHVYLQQPRPPAAAQHHQRPKDEEAD